MTREPGRQVAIREDDAGLTAVEISACLLFALEKVVNDPRTLADERDKAFAIKRSIRREDCHES